ncbi:MAG: FtsQ-type POTRA domain-containing protein [Candidatus Daviesbacteria bacterium]|nr:FtsQ-type POTRA domain-containing protein [Candidatus Daviesbacteria bacterium]
MLIPLILICLFLFLKSGIFTVKQVDVQTGRLPCVDENQIKNSADLAGQNIFLVDSAKVENNLKKKFLCIKSAPVSKIFPDKVKIQTFNREPAAILVVLKEKEASQSSSLDIATPSAREVLDSYKIDVEGVVFSKDTGGLNIPKTYIYDSKISLGKKLEDNLVSNYLVVIEKVKTFGIEVTESFLIDSLFIINSGFPARRIVFRLDEKLDIQLASLQLIMDKAKIDSGELEFIDLRFDKPVVRFAPKK